MDILFTIKHFIYSGHWNGHRVHSPNIFNFFKGAIFYKGDVDYSLAENSRKNFINSDEKIFVLSIGAKGDGKTLKEKKISEIASRSSSYGKYGRLLQRISRYLKPQKILELGTSLGIGTLYLSAGCPTSKVITVEASKETKEFAAKNFSELGLKNIESINAKFDDCLEEILQQNPDIELIYVDGNHTKEATKKYFSLIAQYAKKETVAVFDDINWSKEMSSAWKEIKTSAAVSVSIETLRMGIVFFDKTLTEKYYIARY
ncbi:MAG: class I SAM-dependent methyltransferase [Bacteroidales bacterium]|nr:class I SAM-dependent methyltransferase [Bacteroidales bacterium]